MRQLRTCDTAQFNTGVTKCEIDFAKIRGAIIVPYNTKLPKELTAEKLETLAHAEPLQRVYGIDRFVEYAKNGGEAQTAANGYGPEEFTGFSARKDTFTRQKFSPELHASITGHAHIPCGVYFFDENKVLYGLNDGTEELAPFPMSTVYSDATPHPTSSAKSTMSITFAYEDAMEAVVGFDFIKLDFDPRKLTLGLTKVYLKRVSNKIGVTGNVYKLYEAVGGLDVTSIYGPLIVTAGETVLDGKVTAVTYDDANETLIIAADDNDTPNLKSPAVLYENGIKGIEAVKV